MSNEYVLKFYTLGDANNFLALARAIKEAGNPISVSTEEIKVFTKDSENIYRIQVSVEDKEKNDVNG